MSQYNTGTVTVTNGSATVTGASTLFSANVTVGDFFTVVGDNAFYTVDAVDSDTQLILAANYAGVTDSAKAYTIVNDFTTNLGFPVPNQGDIETALVIKRAIEEIDSELNTAGIGGDGREWIDLKDQPTFISASQFKIANDKTASYHVNRRIRATDSATLYGAITASSFAAGETTITVAWDTGGMTAGLTAVALGIVSANAPAITGDAMVGGTITGVSSDAPTLGAHVANKNYVDGLVVSGVFWKQPVRVASTANITLSGEQTIDGVLTAADRVLVKDQTTASENGIYVTAAGAWARAADADADAEVIAGIAVYVAEGTVGADKAYTLTTDDPITVGTTALTFAQFGGGGVTDVTGSAPITSSGGTTPDIAISAATTSAAGSMSAADKSKLDGVESAATTDQTNAEIKTAYEANADTNAFDDAEQSKLAGIEAAADVTDAVNVNAAGAIVHSDIAEATGFLRKTAAETYVGVEGVYAKSATINGNFDIWQRGASFAGLTAVKYTADRWRFNPSGATATVSRQAFTIGQTDVPGEPEFYLRMDVTVGNALARMEQYIENVRTFAGETITVGFYAKSDSAIATFQVSAAQNFGSGGSASVTLTNVVADTTTSWQKYETTFNLASISGKTIGTGSRLEIWIVNNTTGTQALDIAQVQVELGAVATPFERRPIAEELALCMRYYQQSYEVGTAVGTVTDAGSVKANIVRDVSNQNYTHVALGIAQRAAATITIYSTASGASGNYRNQTDTNDVAATVIDTVTKGFNMRPSSSTNQNLGDVVYFHWAADAEL